MSEAERVAPVHNEEDFEGTYWDPWEELGIGCGGYGSDVDCDAIAVLQGIVAGQYNTDIAKNTGMSPSHVELWQYIFCSADWCEYGTSPRGCFPNYNDDVALSVRIAGWKAYYERHWSEPYEPRATLTNGGEHEG